MEALINIIKENGAGKENAIEEIANNIEEACHKDELYELSFEALNEIFQHTNQLNFNTSRTIISKTAAKYGEKSVNILSFLHVDEGMSEVELEKLLSLIPGIRIFSLLSSKSEENARKNLEEEMEKKNKVLELYETEIIEIKLRKELTELKEMESAKAKIEQDLKTFEGMNVRNRKNIRFCDKLRDEIKDKQNKLKESIVKAKSHYAELQKFLNESNKIIQTSEKSQKQFPKLEKKFTEINSKFQRIEKFDKIDKIEKFDRIEEVLIGDSNCGKTCLFKVLETGQFTPDPATTVGISCKFFNSRDYNILIWDTPGNERFRSLSTAYIRNSAVILLCFSKNSRKEFDDLFNFWVIDGMLEMKDVILVKTKIDLEDDPDKDVPREEVTQFAIEKGYEYFEVSAATGEGINELKEYIMDVPTQLRESND